MNEYRLVEALESVANESENPFRKSRSTAVSPPDYFECQYRRAQRAAAQGTTSVPSAGNLMGNKLKQLDAARATSKPYLYWHQSGFAERNPPRLNIRPKL